MSMLFRQILSLAMLNLLWGQTFLGFSDDSGTHTEKRIQVCWISGRVSVRFVKGLGRFACTEKPLFHIARNPLEIADELTIFYILVIHCLLCLRLHNLFFPPPSSSQSIATIFSSSSIIVKRSLNFTRDVRCLTLTSVFV